MGLFLLFNLLENIWVSMINVSPYGYTYYEMPKTMRRWDWRLI